MRFTIDAALLKAALKCVSQSVSRSDVKELSCVSISARGGFAEIESNDLNTAMRKRVECVCEAEGSTLVPYSRLSQLITGFKGDVSIVADGGSASISCGKTRISLPTLSVDDWPSFSNVRSGQSAVMPSESFKSCVSALTHAVARRQKSGTVLEGIKMAASDGKASFEATDSYRVASTGCDCEGEIDVVMPASVFSPDFTGDVTIRSDGSKIEIDDGSTSVVSRCFEGRWPNVSTIISKADDASSSATVDSDELASCATIAGAVSLTMRIEFSGMSAKVSASGKDGERMVGEVFCEVDGEFSVCVNAKYLIDCMSKCEGDVRIGFVGERSPVFITDGRIIEAIMPIRETR